MNALIEFLSRFNRRDQAALLICGAAVVVYLLWLLLLQPLSNTHQQQLRTNASAAESLARVEVMAAQLKQAKQNGTDSAQPDSNISQLIYSSLQAQSIVLSQFQPGNAGEARVRLDKADFNALLHWLYDLESNHRVNIKELSIAAANDPGQVSVNVRLQR